MQFKSLALLFVIFGLSSFSIAWANQEARQKIRLDDDWKFMLGDPDKAAAPDFDDAHWRIVTVPHDWSIESKIDPAAPMGGSGGFFPSGIGWYRHKLEIAPEQIGKHIEVEFEGIYENASIYLNGKKLYTQPYGYTTFFVDLTHDVQPGHNELAVRVDNSQQKNSRWYAGSGIYRHVWLHVTDPVHVSNEGVFVRTDNASDAEANLSIDTEVSNTTGQPMDVQIVSTGIGPDNKEVFKATGTVHLPENRTAKITSQAKVDAPPLWSPETPNMCKITTDLVKNATIIDSVVTPFGIRKLAWNVSDGLTLNGHSYKLKGGCTHSDNGVLGTCAFDRAEERKVEVLKAAGFNAIRTAHNPYSPSFLNACDQLGVMVMENAFDCWTKGKNPKDYSLYFKDWWRKDLDAMILRDRNHPSIVLWDLGNEVPSIFSSPDIADYAPKLAQEAHGLDSTRPVTIATNGWPGGQNIPIAETSWSAQDIVGSNYQINNHIKQHDQFPQRLLLSTESLPPLGQVDAVMKNSYVVGDFVWTAQDYLGESGIGRWFTVGDPTEPLDKPDPKKPGEIKTLSHGSDKLYPWHGSSCGLVDLLGFPKPVAKYWNVRWQTGLVKLGMAVLQPQSDSVKVQYVPWGWYPSWDSWTWPGWEGKPMSVEVYSTYAKTRLYLNDNLVGEQGIIGGKTTYKLNYAPGVLKAVGLDGSGTEVESTQFKTTGDAAGISLKPDHATITADGQDLSFVRVEVVDQAGQVQPNAGNTIRFSLRGPGAIAGLGNANTKDPTPYQGTECHVFHGVALVVLRSSRTPGTLELKATADGLTPAATQVVCH